MNLRVKQIALSLILLASAILSCTTSAAPPLSSVFRPKSNADMFKVTVRIMNQAESAGGTGVILHSDLAGSIIMTNKHVCGLIEVGGIVDPPNHVKTQIRAFKEDPNDDLCLMYVASNLNMNLKVANKLPKLGDKAIIAGHPALLPTIVTEGHFSERMSFMLNSESGPKAAEGQIVSATIMPGSSGSPVFNSKGEIAGLVFAGGGDLSYAIIVPLESIYAFLSLQNQMPWIKAEPLPEQIPSVIQK